MPLDQPAWMLPDPLVIDDKNNINMDAIALKIFGLWLHLIACVFENANKSIM